MFTFVRLGLAASFSLPLTIDPRELEKDHSAEVEAPALSSPGLEQREEDIVQGEDDGRSLALIKLEDVGLGGSSLRTGAGMFKSTPSPPRDLHKHIKALASNTVDTEIEQLKLGRAVIECIQHVDRLAQLQREKSNIFASANFVSEWEFRASLDLSGQIDLTRTTRLLSLERGLYELAWDAMKRCGEPWGKDHIMKIGESFSRGPGFLDPLIEYLLLASTHSPIEYPQNPQSLFLALSTMESPSNPPAANLHPVPERATPDPSPSPNVSTPSLPDFDTFVASLPKRFPLQDPDLLDVFKAGLRAGCELATAHIGGKSGGTECNIDGFLDKYEGVLEGIRNKAYGKGVAGEGARLEGAGSQPRVGKASPVASRTVRERKESEGLKEEDTITRSHSPIKVEELQGTLPVPSSSSLSSQATSHALVFGQVQTEDLGPLSLTTSSSPRSQMQEDIQAMAKTLAELDLTKYRLGHHVADALSMIQRIVHLQSRRLHILSRQADNGDLESVQHFVEQQRATRQARFSAGVPFFEPDSRISSQDVILVGQRFAEQPGFLDTLVEHLWNESRYVTPFFGSLTHALCWSAYSMNSQLQTASGPEDSFEHAMTQSTSADKPTAFQNVLASDPDCVDEVENTVSSSPSLSQRGYETRHGNNTEEWVLELFKFEEVTDKDLVSSLSSLLCPPSSTGGRPHSSTSTPAPPDCHSVVQAVASQIVDIQLTRTKLGCAVVESLKHTERLSLLHLKKSETFAAANVDSERAFYERLRVDPSRRSDFARNIQSLSLERELDKEVSGAIDRCGGQFTVKQILGLADMFSSDPGSLNPLVQDLWRRSFKPFRPSS
ncbi:hypothetical protein NMY22_g12570 [Coprinellus aureogranulatus]|nr:hypothetical protein NMY22_g12570 [Coprinellus aureogranulatus]